MHKNYVSLQNWEKRLRQVSGNGRSRESLRAPKPEGFPEPTEPGGRAVWLCGNTVSIASIRNTWLNIMV